MNFIKRAGITLWAKKGRTLLLIVTAAVILLFVMTGLIIQNAALQAAKTATNSVGSTVTLSTNREAAFKAMQSAMSSVSSTSDSTTNRPKMTEYTTSLSTVEKIAQLSNVASYNITNTAQVAASGFSAITSDNSGQGGQFNNGNATISLSGVSTTAGNTDFTSGSNKIKSGRGIETSDKNSNNAVISQELAKSNNLNVGSTLTVKYTNDSNATSSYKLKVVGIYADTTSDSTDSFRDPANTIYTNYTLVNTVKNTPDQVSNVSFTMADSSKTKAFVKTATKDINTKQMQLTSDSTVYEQTAKQMQTVASYANKIVWVVTVAGALILGLIIILMTRERRHESGILVALGESKIKILGQYFVELIVILAIGLGIAAASGQAMSGVVGKQLVNQSISAAQNNQTGANGAGAVRGNMQAGGRQGFGNHQMAGGLAAKQSLQTVITPGTILELGGVALLIAVLSVAGASSTILRLQPKKILQDD